MRTLTLAVLSLVCAASAFAMPKKGGPTKSTPILQAPACIKDLDSASSQVDALIKRGRATGRLDPKETAEVMRMEKKIDAHTKAAKASGGMSQKECEKLLAETKDELGKLSAMIGVAEKRAAPACIADLKKANAEVDALIKKGRTAGRFDPRELAEIAKMEKAIDGNTKKAQDGRGISQAECDQLKKDVAAEAVKINAMIGTANARPIPAPNKPGPTPVKKK